MKLTKTVLVWSVAAISLTGTALARQSATVTLKSGATMSAQLTDLGGGGFTVRVDGQERQIPANDVAAIDFTGGTVSRGDWDKLSGNGQVLMLKSGENINGQLIDIGGAGTLRLTFRTPSGERDFSSNDVARIVMARPDNMSATTAAANTAPAGALGVTVSSQQAWTPTGLTVRKGDWVTFSATGEVRVGGDGNMSATPDGVSSNAMVPGAPLPRVAAGALIGRIGTSIFGIGNQKRLMMPAAGQLMLGVNDAQLQDNDGAFQVQVASEGGGTIRR